MGRWRLITVPALIVLPFGLAGVLGARHTPSTLPTCIDVVGAVDFERSPIDGLWVRQIEINNCGGGPVALDEVFIDGPGHDDGFSIVGALPTALDVDRPLTLTIGFTPERLGEHTGALRIAATGRPALEVELTGTGISPGPGSPGPAERCETELPGGFVARGVCLDTRQRPSDGWGPTAPRSPGTAAGADPPDMAPAI